MNTPKNSPKLSNLILLGIIISIIITFSGVVYYKKEKKITRAEKYNELKAIADLKTKQIEQWNRERHSEVVFFAKNYATVKDVESLLKTDNSRRISLYKSLSHMLSDNRYQNIFILSPDNDILFTIDSTLQTVDSKTKTLSAKSITEKSIVFSDFYYCEICKKLLLDFVSPIRNKDDKIIATIFFRVNPNDYIFPIIEFWPTPSKTAETLIVEKENDSVVFINKLRHINNVPLKFKVPLSSNNIPAVKAVHGFEGFFEGVDYRGTEVLSITSKIHDTNWYMIAKVDKDEIYSDLYSKATYIVVISIITFLLLNITIFWIYHLKQRNLYKQLFTAKIDLYQSKEELRATLYSIGDGVITTDMEGKIKRMNPVAVGLTGWTEREAIGKSLSAVFNIVNEENKESLIDPSSQVLKEGITVELGKNIILISKNGSEIPIADSAAPVYDRKRKIIGVVIVFRDQSSEREAQKSFKVLHEKIFSIIYTSPLSIIVTNLNGEVTLWNQAAEKTFGWNETEVLGKPNPIIPPDKLDEVKLIRQRVINGEVIKNVETTRITKQGNRIDVSFSVSILRDQNDKPLEVLGIVTDITERKRFENELKENEIQYHNLADSGVALIWTSDNNKLCNYFNVPWLMFTGRSLDQELGNGWAEGVHPKDLDFCFNTFVTAFDKREPFEIEYRLKHNSGEYRWIKDMGTPNLNRNGEFIGYIGHCFDITEQKMTEKMLIEKEELYHYMFANNPQPMWIYDMETLCFLEVNDAAINHYGYLREEFLSMTLKDIRPKEDIEALLQDVEKTKKTYNPAGQWRHIKKNGELIYVEIISHSITFNNRKARHVMVNDITARKLINEKLHESEERFRKIFEEGSIGMVMASLTTGNIIGANKEFCNIIGYTEEELKQLTFTHFTHPDDREKDIKGFNNLREGQIKKYNTEKRYLKKNGEEIWAFLSLTKIVAQGGHSAYALAMVQDITARKQSEELLRESQNKFKKLVWDMQVGVLLHGSNSEILLNNPKALELLGINENQLLGKTSFDPDWNVIHEDGSPFPGLTHPVPQAIATHSPVRGVIMGVYHPLKGEYVWLLVDAVPQLNADKSIHQVVCTFIDITELKQAEHSLQETSKQLELTLRSSKAGTWEWDVVSGQITWSTQMFELFNLDPNSTKASFEVWRATLHPEDIELAEKRIAQALNDHTFLNSDYRVILANGQIRWINASGEGVYDEGGKPVQMVGICIDITARKEAEEKIFTQLDELQRWQKVTLKREDRNIELKREVNELLIRLNEPIRYPSQEIKNLNNKSSLEI